MKRTGPTNYLIVRLARELRKTSNKYNSKIWKRVAEVILLPRRKRVEVNLSKINRFAEDGDIILVPGKVLAAGNIEKKVTVAALAFSEMAIRKIREAGGRTITLRELIKENPKGSKVKILI